MTNISRRGLRQVTKNGTFSSPADARRGKLLELTYIILFVGKCQQLLITWFIGKILIFNKCWFLRISLRALRLCGKIKTLPHARSLRSLEYAEGAEKVN